MSQVHIKVNNTIGQILLAKRLGKTVLLPKRVQHGVATATVCALMGLECIVYMGEVDIKRQAPNIMRNARSGNCHLRFQNLKRRYKRSYS
jgi:tryptophan synthase beta subunit